MAMFILGKCLLQSHNHRKERIAMSASKVENPKTQIKLVFGDVAPGKFPVVRVMEEIGLEFHAFATSAGVLLMKAMMAAEEELLAGTRQSHGTPINRWCKEEGSVMVGGQKVKLERQRLRTRDGKEVRLETYDRFRANDARAHTVYERLVAGVSCRDYEQTVEEVAAGFGVSKSVVNRDMVRATAKDLAALCERDLSTIDAWAFLVDGVKVGASLIVVALGLDLTGRKHVLGFREGSTENSRVCTDLFHDLRRRGFRVDHPMLVVIDGSKALRSAVDEFFGEQAEVARCHQHKCQNVKGYLPQEYHVEYDRKMRAAWAMRDYTDARRALAAVVRDLGRINTQAAASLEEGFEETLTLHRLGVPPVVRVHLETTNLIESLFAHPRRIMRNVKRWRPNSDQASRWIATGLLHAERRMRRIKGYKSMPVLRTVLEEEAVKKTAPKRSSAA